MPALIGRGAPRLEPKDTLRARLLAARAQRDPALASVAGAALAAAVIGLRPMGDRRPVAAYSALPGEPPTEALLADLVGAGVTVLLPVLRADGDLDLAPHDGRLVAGRRGTVQPVGAPVDARPGLVVVPALAVDRSGRRLGRGGGSYDRALPRWRAAGCGPVVALVWDTEVLSAVPTEAHDALVDLVLTPTAIIGTQAR